MLPVRWFICLLAGMVLIAGGCKKDNTPAATSKLQWMHVLQDTLISSTDDEIFQGRNGKILSDSSDNLYLYYYQSLSKQSVVMKCDSKGAPVWKKYFPDCEPMDMILAGSDLVLAVRLSPLQPKGIVFYIIHDNGTIETKTLAVGDSKTLGVNDICMTTLLDNSLLVSGSYDNFDVNPTPVYTRGYIMRLNTNYTPAWDYYLSTVPGFNVFFVPVWGQNSIVPLKTNQFLFEYSISLTLSQTDSMVYGLLTGLIGPNGMLGALHFNPTGYRVRATGVGAGHSNRYCNGLIRNTSGAIYHYSDPEIFHQPGPLTPNGFLMLNDSGMGTDTAGLDLPSGYRILSVTPNNGTFLLEAYKAGLASGTSDYSANQTLFLYGENWATSTSFTLQEFYADFFPSSAPSSDGGFVMMGKIQSFNGTANKLVLVKWKNS